MPWVVKKSSKCPSYKPWAVINQQSGAKEGCHPSKEAATQQQKALYAKEPQMNSVATDCGCSSPAQRADRLRSLAAHLERVEKRPELAPKLRQQARQQDSDWDDDPGHLAQGVDAILDGALTAFQAGEVDQGVALTVGAAAAMDSLLASLGLTDADEVGPEAVGMPMNMNSAPKQGEFFRAIPFEMVQHSDGLTLEGYAAVFNSPARIGGWEGDFEETIAPGAFGRTLRERTPVLMFEHGKHPLIGSMPLGVIRQASEDSKGVYIEARLSDNWLIQPVRDAVRDGAITGMSFRFTVPEGGDSLVERKGTVPLRTLNDVDVRELGPVVFPAYEPTTATVRSALDSLSDLTGRSDAWSADGGVPTPDDAQPGNGKASRLLLPAALRTRDRVLRMKGVL